MARGRAIAGCGSGLNLKRLAYDYVGVDLLAGEARRAPYTGVNRQGLLPALETDDGVLTQSLAILEWLEETHPEPPLLPATPRDRATVRAMADIIACDIHPLNNLRVLQKLNTLGVTASARPNRPRGSTAGSEPGSMRWSR